MALVGEALSIPSWKLEVGRVVVDDVLLIVDCCYCHICDCATCNRQFDFSCDIFFLVLFHSHLKAVKVERLNLANGPSLCSESTLSIFFEAIGYQRAPSLIPSRSTQYHAIFIPSVNGTNSAAAGSRVALHVNQKRLRDIIDDPHCDNPVGCY
eukprot:scaffold49309_cov48-Cyclotella_meneghiniana.AAC.2